MSYHLFMFAVMIEYLDIVLAERKSDTEILDAVRGVHNSFKIFIENARRHMDADRATPEMSADFALLMEAVQATSKNKIRTKETLHKHLRSLIEIVWLLQRDVAFDRKQLATLTRLKDCLTYLKDKAEGVTS